MEETNKEIHAESHKKRVLSKKAIIAIVIIVLAIIAVVSVMLFIKKSNEEELNKSLEEMGKSFYENFYYEQIGNSSDERSALLSKFTTVGIKVDLDNLSRYDDGKFKDEISKFVNNQTNAKCNTTNTKVTIYPKSPYGKTDYSVKTELDCGFDKEK